MYINTKRFTLLPCTIELVKQRNEYKAGDHIHMYLQQLQHDASLLGWGAWYVLEQNTNEIIGDIGFKGKPNEGEVEVGYGMIPSVRGKGYASEAVAALLQWAFGTGEVQIVLAECLKTNGPSIRVLEKLGFIKTYEGSEMLYWKKYRL
ncbi:MAG: GNAT family N-acetyltransferase [Ectobacillus sp.]